MPRQWRTIRVFISSTFRDMHAERDHLVRYVFPRLRDDLLSRRVRLVDIDLRWGVTEEQNSVDLCLDEIDRCQYFIGILGHRYGTVPSHSDLREDIRDSDKYKYLLKHEGGSITALEIEYGALRTRAEQGRSFIYLRSPQWLDSVPCEVLADFCESAPARVERLTSLKQRLEESSIGAVREYSCSFQGFRLARDISDVSTEDCQALRHAAVSGLIDPLVFRTLPIRLRKAIARPERVCLGGLRTGPHGNQSFCEMVYSDLLAAIMQEVPAPEGEREDEFSVERQAMEDFALERAGSYIVGANLSLLEQIEEFARSKGGSYLCLTGEPGSGKSALLSYVGARARLIRPGQITLLHFVGATQRSANQWWILRRVCQEISTGFEISIDIPQDHEGLRRTLPRLLELVAPRQLLIIFDGVDQIDSISGSISLGWLPDSLPDGVHIILSAATSAPLLNMLRRLSSPRELLVVIPMGNSEVSEIIDTFLRRYRKTLEPRQRELLLGSGMSKNPLYLFISLEEIRTLGDRSELHQRLQNPPTDTIVLFDAILERLEAEYGLQLVSAYAGYICASRFGVTQLEMRSLIAREDPEEQWPALQRILRPYLIERDTLIDFFHLQLRRAAQVRYLDSNTKRERNQRLAEMHSAEYEKLGAETSERTFTELTYQCYQVAIASGYTTELERYLQDKTFQLLKFRKTRRVEAVFTDFDYGIALAVKNGTAREVFRYSVARSNFNAFLTKRLLYRLANIADEDPLLAISTVGLVSDPGLRRLAFLLLPLNASEKGASVAETQEAIGHAVGTLSQIPLFQVTVTIDLIRQLAPRWPEVTSILQLVPICEERAAYERAWINASGVLGDIGQSLAKTRSSAPSTTRFDAEQYHKGTKFAKMFASGAMRRALGPDFEEIVAEQFGSDHLSAIHLLIAAEFIRMNRRDDALLFMNRAIYVGQAKPRVALRTLCGLAEAVGRFGEVALEEEHLERVETLTRVDLKYGSPSARTEAGEIRAEAEAIFAQCSKASNRTLGLRLRKARQDAGVELTSISEAYCCALRNQTADTVRILERLLTSDSSASLQDVTAAHALATELRAERLAKRTTQVLLGHGTDPQQLFESSGAERLLQILGDGQGIHAACVASALRSASGTKALLNFVRIICTSGARWSLLDAALGQLVRLQEFSIKDLRVLGDELLTTEGNLAVPMGLGIYFFPGFTLLAISAAAPLLGAGAQSAIALPSLIIGCIQVMAAMIIGALVDLAIWTRIDVWHRPELSGKLSAEGGTYLAIIAALALQSWQQLPAFFIPEVLAGITLPFFALVLIGVRGNLFAPLRRRLVATVVFAAVLAFVSGLLVSMFFLTRYERFSLAGLFFAGTLWLAMAINLGIKGLIVRARFEKRWSPEEREEAREEDHEAITTRNI
jgi:hypothetical protein